MKTSGFYNIGRCCAATITTLGYDAKPMIWDKEGKTQVPWKPSPFYGGAGLNEAPVGDKKKEGTGNRGWIDLIFLAESQRPEMEPALLSNGYVLVKERMFNGVDSGSQLHNGGLVSLYVKEEKPEYSPTHPDFDHENYVVEKHRIRSKKNIEESKQPGKEYLYGMTGR